MNFSWVNFSARSTCRTLQAGLVCAGLALVASDVAAQDFARVAPYRDVIWEDGQPRVLLDDRWYEWVAVEGIPVDSLESASRDRWGDLWDKRIAEDLVEVLALFDLDGRTVVDLTVRDSVGVQVRRDVPMTESNRASVLRARRARAGLPTAPAPLTRATALQDLAILRQWLEERFAYLRVGGVDVEAAFERVADGISAEPDRAAFALSIQAFLSNFVDGHAGVAGFSSPRDYLPFILEPTGDRWAAVLEDRSRLVDPEFPYVVALDGLPIDRWSESARALIPNGSASLVLDETARWLRSLGLFRERLGLEPADSVVVELESRLGQRRTVTITVGDRLPIRGAWPRRGSGFLDGGVAYLRLPAMDQNAVEEIRRWMPRFANAPGLVIDVRGNGGGSREALRELLPYVLEPDSGPRVVNVASYRAHPDHSSDHLESRWLYRADDPRWADEERVAIRRAVEAFQPEWEPPADEFGDWHYMVVSPSPDPGAHFAGPVAVLLDQRAFSATDIFLGAFADLTDAVLVGAASRGGSARAVVHLLPNSQLSVRFATMASYRPDGRLYDGRGVHPDVLVPVLPEYHVLNGPDPILERAQQLVSGR